MSKIVDKKILICPECKSENLNFTNKNIICLNCNSKYFFENNKYIFKKMEKTDIADILDRFKFSLKKFGFIYNLLIKLISPVCPTSNIKRIFKKYKDNKNIIAINLGSGNSNISKDISNVDIFLYENVDLTCDIENLPFKNNSIDVVINIAVLEHVPYPEKVVDEIYRILKTKGLVISFFPFMQPYHASPYDFSRRTYEGMKILYKDFKIIKLINTGGPTSGFLWCFQEWIALLFSFGIKPLYNVIIILIMLITFPLKFLDFILIKHPMAKNISSGFLFIGEKK